MDRVNSATGNALASAAVDTSSPRCQHASSRCPFTVPAAWTTALSRGGKVEDPFRDPRAAPPCEQDLGIGQLGTRVGRLELGEAVGEIHPRDLGQPGAGAVVEEPVRQVRAHREHGQRSAGLLHGCRPPSWSPQPSVLCARSGMWCPTCVPGSCRVQEGCRDTAEPGVGGQDGFGGPLSLARLRRDGSPFHHDRPIAVNAC